MKRRPRILIGKVGLDGHDVGARVVARALADAGMEVIYTGLRQTPEMIVRAAVEEGVDVIGISILSGSHMTLLPEILRILKRYHADDIPVVAGGIIPVEDIPALKEAGVKEIFPPDTPTSEIIDFINQLVESRSTPSPIPLRPGRGMG
jgi:methylmalonyl-CoA mutase C-terminal domain/subunit